MINKHHQHIKTIAAQQGYIALLVLIFAGVFITIISGLTVFVALQHKTVLSKEKSEKVLHIAEAGLEYYKWFLLQNPGDITDGTGEQGPYIHIYEDPETGVIGSFSLSVDGNTTCGQTTAIDITSTGWVEGDEDFTRTIKARYAQPSVAEYSNIINSNVWAGSDRNISGRYHANGGIRMDGANNSLVTSAVSTWSDSFDCNDDGAAEGVCGDGPNNNLWQYPKPEIDFSLLIQSVPTLKSYAQTGGGLYFASLDGTEDQKGYHFNFQNDGTVDVYEVTDTDWVWGYHGSYGYDYSGYYGYRQEYNTITGETFVGNYNIPDSCSLVFVEDKIWVEGTLSEKVTVVSADTGSYKPDAILQGNINYTAMDGTAGLTVIAENYILIPIISPDNMNIRGVFVAQNGRFGRNYYSSSYSPYHRRDSLTINGTVVSNERTSSKWTCSGSYCSGYENRTNTYDRALAQDPPPFTPFATTTSLFVKWEEI